MEIKKGILMSSESGSEVVRKINAKNISSKKQEMRACLRMLEISLGACGCASTYRHVHVLMCMCERKTSHYGEEMKERRNKKDRKSSQNVRKQSGKEVFM